MSAADLLKASDPAGALKALTDDVRAKPGDFKAQTHAVFHTPAYPSAISVSVVPDAR